VRNGKSEPIRSWVQLMMQLSPCTNYAIRRMLKEHVDSVSVVQACVLTVSETTNLNLLLQRLYPRRFEIRTKVRHLETLVQLYQQVSNGSSGAALVKREIRHRIFQILRIRFGVQEVMLPEIVPEALVSSFYFFRGGQVREGVEYQNKFYGKIDEAAIGGCSRLYQLALVLAEQELPVLMTTSLQSYSLWVTLRSPTYGVFLRDGLTPLQKALSLHSVLCRCKQAKL
jgi:hypothetical protein